MSDYVDFQYNLKELSVLCASDERTQYTRFYKFEHPNCHRIQGGLRTGNGKIRVALVVFPDSDDKHLAWPVELEYKVLACVKGKTEFLSKEKIKREARDVEIFSEKISWTNSISVSLKKLKEKNVIGADDSVTFMWSVKLCCPPQAENVDLLDAQRKQLDKLKRLERAGPKQKDPRRIRLRCRDVHGNRLSVTILKTSPISRLMDAYCGMTGYDFYENCLFFDGEPLLPYKTPYENGLENDDLIDVFQVIDGEFGRVIK